MNATWTKGALLAAAAWNLVGGATALLDPSAHFAQLFTGSLSLDDPIQVFFYQCVWINVMAWGAAYAIAAVVPASRTAVLAAGGLGKLVYFLASAALFQSGAGKAGLLAAGMVDLVFVALFALALVSTLRNTQPGREVRAAA